MTASTRLLPLPRVTSPMREVGSSSLDRRTIAWPAPDPAMIVSCPWPAPLASTIIGAGRAPWSAPNARHRVDLAAPAAVSPVDVLPVEVSPVLIEPTHSVAMPDLVAITRTALAGGATFAPPTVTSGQPLPPPRLADAARVIPGANRGDRSGVSRRLAVGVTVVAGFCCAVVAAVAIF